MNSHANAIAFRSLLVLSLSIGSLVFLRSALPSVIRAVTPSGTNQRAAIQPPNIDAGLQACGPSVEKPPLTIEVTAVRPVIVKRDPVPAPRISGINVGPNDWSAPVTVPAGAQVGIRFTMNKIQIEKNGENIGFLRKNPVFVPSDESPNAVRVRPFAMFNQSPREVWFKQDAEVLRFRSSDGHFEKVSVLWR